MQILVIGSANIDFVFYLDNFPNKGQTVRARNVEKFFGGKGANQAVALKKMGTELSFIYKVGEDNNGYEFIENLYNLQIDMPLILKSDLLFTGTANVLLEQNGDNRIIIDSGANNNFTSEDIEKIKLIIDNYDFILLQMEINYFAILEIINIAYAKQKYIILNPAPVYKFDLELLNKINLIIPNEDEFCSIFNLEITDLEKLKLDCVEISKKYNIEIIVTMGEKGSLYVNGDKIVHTNAQKVKAIDTTGAGDTFIAGFISSILKGHKIEESLEFASKAAAISVTKKGAQTSIPTYQEIIDFEW